MDDIVKAVKAALLLTTDDDLVNTEIRNLISAAIADLRTAGVAKKTANTTGEVSPTDAARPGDRSEKIVQSENAALYGRGVILYCKAHFLLDETAARRAASAYAALKAAMSLDDSFREGVT